VLRENLINPVRMITPWARVAARHGPLSLRGIPCLSARRLANEPADCLSDCFRPAWNFRLSAAPIVERIPLSARHSHLGRRFKPDGLGLRHSSPLRFPQRRANTRVTVQHRKPHWTPAILDPYLSSFENFPTPSGQRQFYRFLPREGGIFIFYLLKVSINANNLF
jgi:hypothetical protein